MASIANLTLVNAAAGNVTYVPEKADGVSASWVDSSPGFLSGFRTVALRKQMPKKSGSGEKLRVRTTHVYPTVDANGVLLRSATVYTDYVFEETHSLADRQEVYAREKSLQATAVVKDAVEQLILPL